MPFLIISHEIGNLKRFNPLEFIVNIKEKKNLCDRKYNGNCLLISIT